MADPSVTYSFSNGEVASAPNVNQNFNDILGAIRSASTADLGCGTLKVASVPFSSAVVSAMQSASVDQLTVVNTFTAGTVSATAGQFGNIPDYTAGSFNGSYTGFETTHTTTISYVKFGNFVMLNIPCYLATSTAGTFGITGMPSTIYPDNDTWGSLGGTGMQVLTATCGFSGGILGGVRIRNYFDNGRIEFGLPEGFNSTGLKGLPYVIGGERVTVSYQM